MYGVIRLENEQSGWKNVSPICPPGNRSRSTEYRIQWRMQTYPVPFKLLCFGFASMGTGEPPGQAAGSPQGNGLHGALERAGR
jgi:hypothetical protein